MGRCSWPVVCVTSSPARRHFIPVVRSEARRAQGRGPAKIEWLAAAGWLGMVRGEAAELYSRRRVVGVVVAY